MVPGVYQQRIHQYKLTMSVAASAPVQKAVAAYLASGAYPRHLRKVRRLYSQNVAAVSEAVGRCFPAGTRLTRPKGGFVLWAEVPQPFDSIRLYQDAQQEGISVAPGPISSLCGKFALHLNAAVWSPEVAGAIETLGKLARRQIEAAA